MNENNIITLPVVSDVINTDYSEVLDIRSPHNRPFAARVNIHKYRDAIRKYEARLEVSNAIKRATEFIMAMDIIFILFISSGIDAEEQLPIIMKLLCAGMIIALIGALVLHVPSPRLPKGISIIDGRYVIVQNVYPGHNPIIIGRDCVFRDKREVSVIPFEEDERNY